MKKALIVSFILVLAFCKGLTAQMMISFDAPGTNGGTDIYGIDGNKFVGTYNTSNGFIYDLSTNSGQFPFNKPGAGSTRPWGISGDKIVGTYNGSIGFWYDMTTNTWNNISVPSATPRDIDGNNITGSSGINGFVYDIITSTYTILSVPGISVRPWSISGDVIVGDYNSASQGFYYDKSTNIWQTLVYPSSTLTSIQGIDGRNVVGFYQDTSGKHHGFFYNLDDSASWLTIDYPGTNWTHARGISGNTIVGSYRDSLGTNHGFVYTMPIPEPSTSALLVVFGSFLFVIIKRRHRL